MTSTREENSNTVHAILGGISVTVSKTAAAPIERVKLLIQSQDEMIKQGRLTSPYRGVFDCFSRTIKNEGKLSLWRGNTVNVLRYFPNQALNFAFNDIFKHMFSKDIKKDEYTVWLVANLASGGLAGYSSSLFVYSLDFARNRLANDVKLVAKEGGKRQFKGFLDVYRKTLASDGIVGLYRGFNIYCTGIVVYRGLYFGLYDSLKPAMPEHLRKDFLTQFLFGWAVTTFAGLATYPIDTVRCRMMMTSGAAVKYKSSLHAFKEIITKEGTKSLFKGGGVNIFRSVAGTGALLGYDQLRIIMLTQKY
ncbi:ADP/ATP carrier protein aac3 [Apophysomyces sp. BC1034]|nr:ADP/ATP carrier protein aac3 [Apophysomyces sp. BC1021]KAG0184509.1 ADP/ATP carrier protein aac3 [Apophysomyces sp. BC1034]